MRKTRSIGFILLALMLAIGIAACSRDHARQGSHCGNEGLCGRDALFLTGIQRKHEIRLFAEGAVHHIDHGNRRRAALFGCGL